jgi:hypothetical protein
VCEIYKMSFDGQILERGFWLYIWKINHIEEIFFYIGRTGDSSSPYASSPFNRIGSHLDFRENAKGNTLAKRLKEKGVEAKNSKFSMMAIGPIFPEQRDFEAHKFYRDKVATYEYEIANYLKIEGKKVLGTHHRGTHVDESILKEFKERVATFAEINHVMENDLKIDHSFISTWHPKYDEIANDEAEYGLLVDLSNKEIAEKGMLTKQTFLRILNWKSPRVKGILRLSSAFDAYEVGLRTSHTAEENKKLEVLCKLPGVGAPVGSTILHFMYPDSFPIIDVRTTETLHHAGRIERSSTDLTHYASFRSEMLNILRETSCFTLRQIDRALFAYHKIFLSRKQQCETDEKGAKMPTIKDKVLSVFQDRAGQEFGREEISDLVAKAYPGTKKRNIIPSDYCYNSVNKDPASFKLHLFELLGDGKYKCLGPDYPYSGPILWKGEPVGKWEHGKCQLWNDPRK